MPETTWITGYPRISTKELLQGCKLGIFSDIPPEPCSNGMKRLTVDVEGVGKRVILCTDMDIEAILKLREVDRRKIYFFAFALPKGEQYCRAVPFDDVK